MRTTAGERENISIIKRLVFRLRQHRVGSKSRFRPSLGRKRAIFGRNRKRHKMMTRKEKSKQLLRKCFNANEWAFLSMDEGFKKLADGAESIDEVEEVSK